MPSGTEPSPDPMLTSPWPCVNHLTSEDIASGWNKWQASCKAMLSPMPSYRRYPIFTEPSQWWYVWWLSIFVKVDIFVAAWNNYVFTFDYFAPWTVHCDSLYFGWDDVQCLSSTVREPYVSSTHRFRMHDFTLLFVWCEVSMYRGNFSEIYLH